MAKLSGVRLEKWQDLVTSSEGHSGASSCIFNVTLTNEATQFWRIYQ